MKRAFLTIAVSTFLAFSFATSSKAIFSTLTPWPPLAERIVEIEFYVDNREFLEGEVLELAFVQDKFMRRMIPMNQPQEGQSVKGYIQAGAPQGDLTAVICGNVRCKLGEEPELVCGQSFIPSQLAVDKVHQITFSTQRACLAKAFNEKLAKHQ